ncbi:type IV toxin-antitoxin system AbiEi family antitoxin [Nocardioides zeae]|uniref:Type IV toxin-antitoxin system AbiEi family antitoxin n=1 Tax=Nocardioides imazamoxiresistens TaxID=3231893 RepID=A0ABU3PUV1_9ACTN|nr:type IV toxin-antitoxin system AbiEi family antitoxin [Nocardioides zeae]MDT9593002.1 type IV toxin-antitoxin system AbiEi family antitoxin [Nocardioides zeae]
MDDLNEPDLLARVAEVLTSLDLPPTKIAVDGESDLTVTVPTADGGQELHVDVRSQLPRGRRPGAGDVIATEHIATRTAERLRADERFFVDASGNAYIRLPGFLLDVRGRPRRTPARPVTGRAFTRSGARVLFALLVRPELAGTPVRRLAALSGVSIGTTSHVLDDLRRGGHLSSDGGRLLHLPRLAELWLATYQTTIRPHLQSARAAGPDLEWWREQAGPPDVALSGGAALARAGAPVTPSVALVYGTPPWAEIRRHARLRREEPWNVELRERFWSTELCDDPYLAPALLVYADAISGDDPRVATAAEEMWEDHADLRRFRVG